MKYGVSMVPTNGKHVQLLGKYMRAEEVREVEGIMGLGPEDAVKHSIKASRDTYTVLKDGYVLGIFGVNPVTQLGSAASPWLLTTDKMKENPRVIVYWGRYVLSAWKQQYDLLFNFVDARYTQSVNWAKAVGFEVLDPLPIREGGILCHPIRIRKA